MENRSKDSMGETAGNGNLTTLEEFKERNYGRRGTRVQDELEAGYEAFRAVALGPPGKVPGVLSDKPPAADYKVKMDGMRVVFDVGANDGVFSVEDARRGALVYAFEPHPGFCRMIESKISGLPNYNLVRKAVSDFEGRSPFNIFELEDCSSLSELEDGYEDKWPGVRGRMGRLSTIEVEVTTLGRFIEENGIERIDWMYCDVQGHDLNVLRGLGEHHRVLVSGMIEVVRDEAARLYRGQGTISEVRHWLEERGFVVEDVSPNDWREVDGRRVADGNEFNLFFRRP